MIGAVHGTKFEKKWQDGGQDAFDELLLIADCSYEWNDTGGGGVKIYQSKNFNASRMVLEGLRGEVTISFTDELYDSKRQSGMVHAIVSEDNRMQHVWVMIEPVKKGCWRVGPAAGAAILPTQGVQRAVELVFLAVEKSGM